MKIKETAEGKLTVDEILEILTERIEEEYPDYKVASLDFCIEHDELLHADVALEKRGRDGRVG
jgi:hypothetical protein